MARSRYILLHFTQKKWVWGILEFDFSSFSVWGVTKKDLQVYSKRKSKRSKSADRARRVYVEAYLPSILSLKESLTWIVSNLYYNIWGDALSLWKDIRNYVHVMFYTPWKRSYLKLLSKDLNTLSIRNCCTNFNFLVLKMIKYIY